MSVESDDTIASNELASSDTLLAVQNRSSSAMDATLVDEEFLSSTANELATESEPKAALLAEEQARTRRIAPLVLVLAIFAMATLPFFSGTLWAKSILYGTLACGICAMVWLWWLASRAAPIKNWQTTLAWSTAFSATCANSVYFGVFSIASLLMALAVVVFAQGQNRGLALGAYAASALTAGSVALLDSVGVLSDPGLMNASALLPLERLVATFLVQTLFLVSYFLGRFARQSSADALAKTQQAMRELARRDVIAREAREGVRRALNIGGEGRHSGSEIGSFRLAEVIGNGGMGEVYRAQHLTLQTPAAVKIIHPHLCHDKQLVQRFLREAKLSASLDSPHIVRVLDAGNGRAGPFIAMELLQGRDLATHFQEEGVLSIADIQSLARQVGEGLDAAAKAEIVHRDIKPQNLFLLDDAIAEPQSNFHCKILDFGVARAMSGQATVTQGDKILGTPNYMAPEQAQGHPADARADLHALVAVLYRAWTGFVPFKGENPQAVLYSVINKMPLAPSVRADLPDALDAFFTKGFAKAPDERYQSGAELSEALRAASTSILV